MATGDVYALYDSKGNIVDKLIVIVNGDVNGDGKANAADYIAQRRHILGIIRLDTPYFTAADGTVKYFSQKRLCKNEVLRREVRRGGCQAPLICPVAYSGGGVKGAASAAFIGVTGYGHADP